METNLKVGTVFTSEIEVTEERSAKSIGSGGLLVFATPYMIACMENASMLCVQPSLPEGSSTVGTKVDIRHIAATPLGMRVKTTAVLTAVEGRKLTFSVECSDEKELIGKGTHERFIIDIDKFMTKTNSKKS